MLKKTFIDCWEIHIPTYFLLVPKLNKLWIWLEGKKWKFHFCWIFAWLPCSVFDCLWLERISSSAVTCGCLTSQFTLLHHRDPRLALAATQVDRHRVLDPGDGGRGVPAGLAHQHGVPALLHHLHARVLDDGGEPGRDLFVCRNKERKWISRPGTDLFARPFPSCWKFFQFFNEKQNGPGSLFGLRPSRLTKVYSISPDSFFQNILIRTCIRLVRPTVVNGEGGLGGDRITVSILRDALHLALVPLLPDRLYPEKGAALEVWYEISGVCVAQLLPVLLPGEAGSRLAGGVAVEGSNPSSLDFLRGGGAVYVWRI